MLAHPLLTLRLPRLRSRQSLLWRLTSRQRRQKVATRPLRVVRHLASPNRRRIGNIMGNWHDWQGMCHCAPRLPASCVFCFFSNPILLSFRSFFSMDVLPRFSRSFLFVACACNVFIVFSGLPAASAFWLAFRSELCSATVTLFSAAGFFFFFLVFFFWRDCIEIFSFDVFAVLPIGCRPMRARSCPCATVSLSWLSVRMPFRSYVSSQLQPRLLSVALRSSRPLKDPSFSSVATIALALNIMSWFRCLSVG